jgi:hypothetical protein
MTESEGSDSHHETPHAPHEFLRIRTLVIAGVLVAILGPPLYMGSQYLAERAAEAPCYGNKIEVPDDGKINILVGQKDFSFHDKRSVRIRDRLSELFGPAASFPGACRRPSPGEARELLESPSPDAIMVVETTDNPTVVGVRIFGKSDREFRPLIKYDIENELERLAHDLGDTLKENHEAVAARIENELRTRVVGFTRPSQADRHLERILRIGRIQFMKYDCILQRRISDAYLVSGRPHEAFQHLQTNAVPVCPKAQGLDYRVVVINNELVRLNLTTPGLMNTDPGFLVRSGKQAAERERTGEYFLVAVAQLGDLDRHYVGVLKGLEWQSFQGLVADALLQATLEAQEKRPSADADLLSLLLILQRETLNPRPNFETKTPSDPKTGRDPVPPVEQASPPTPDRRTEPDEKKKPPVEKQSPGAPYRCKVAKPGHKYRYTTRRCFR